jgi:hypothetical protein
VKKGILLSKIHALNWYGYQDSIPVQDNLLIAGITGSGKSILMDLIQFVLVGDQRLLRFNQSATGDRSARDVKGYCLGDTKEEEGGVTQFMRNSVVTFIALEFTWPGPAKVETWGFRIEFVSTAETRGQVTPFFVPASLRRADFLDDGKRPLEYGPFKAMIESHVNSEGIQGRIYAEPTEYLTHMAQPTHLNFDRSVVRALLPTAMSFTFLRSFNDFCRQFILPADRLDATDVISSYRAFHRYEQDLRELNHQLDGLRSISETFIRYTEFQRDATVARYLAAELHHGHAVDQRCRSEERLQELRNHCASEDARLEELGRLIPERRSLMEDIKNTIREKPDGPLYLELRNQNGGLSEQIRRLTSTGRTLESALADRVRRSRNWIRQLESMSLPLKTSPVESFHRGVSALEGGGVLKFSQTFRALGDLARPLAEEVSRLARPISQRITELRQAQAQLNEQIGLLEIGKLPFPTVLLDALNDALPSVGAALPAQHLRELCELREGEELWRPAIEVAFRRKLAVVVRPEHYEMAEKLYHELQGDTPKESLINPMKAIKLKKPVRDDSLANKLVTTHPVAEALISHFFGDVVCVSRRDELRRHEAAITPDGFLARGAFVERPQHYDNFPVIGHRGIQQQLLWKRQQREHLAAQERKLRPQHEDFETVQQAWRELFASPDSLYEDLSRAAELPTLQAQLDRNLARLNQIDQREFDELARQSANLEKEVRELEDEQRKLDRSPNRSEIDQLQRDVSAKRKLEEEARNGFERVRAEGDISRWLPRLDELRNDVCTRLFHKDAAAKEFDSMQHENKANAAGQWATLLGLRRELALRFPKFDDFPSEASVNDAYDKQLIRLRESEIPAYKEKAERERRTWEKLFRTQVLEKLRTALLDVENTRLLLNTYLRRPIGNNRYRILKWENPEFAIYHKLLEASALAHEDELFFASADADLRDSCDRFLQVLIDEDKQREAGRLLDYRQYYQYDMEADELGPGGEVMSTTRVDRQGTKFSGGENQSPYFVAILASYLRAYKRHDTRKGHPSLALVPIDEAFSKLSGDCIKDCIEALKSLDLQGIFSMSTGNIPYAFENCDSLVVVSKERKRIGKRLHVRNIPVSLHKDSEEARRLLGLES